MTGQNYENRCSLFLWLHCICNLYKCGKVIAGLSEATYQFDVMRSGVISQHFLNLGTNCT